MDAKVVVKHESDSDEKGAFNTVEVEGNLQNLYIADLPSHPDAHLSIEGRAAIVRYPRCAQS
jgi:hypothetical protein